MAREVGQQCGTCKWWKQAQGYSFGDCEWQQDTLPDWLLDVDGNLNSMFYYMGRECKAWHAK